MCYVRHIHVVVLPAVRSNARWSGESWPFGTATLYGHVVFLLLPQPLSNSLFWVCYRKLSVLYKALLSRRSWCGESTPRCMHCGSGLQLSVNDSLIE